MINKLRLEMLIWDRYIQRSIRYLVVGKCRFVNPRNKNRAAMILHIFRQVSFYAHKYKNHKLPLFVLRFLNLEGHAKGNR